MGILKKVGKAVGGAIVKTGKWTAASIKRKNLQNKVKKMILEKFRKEDLKRMFKEYGVPEPPLPERGYYKKSDYVKWAYSHFKLKTVIQWAQKHRINIKDIMDYYIAEMEKIDREYGSSEESREEDKRQGVEDISIPTQHYESPYYHHQNVNYNTPMPLPPPTPPMDPYEEIIASLERDLQDYISQSRYADEEEFRKMVFGFLSRFMGKHEIKIPSNTSSMGDIVIDRGQIILELKYANNPSTLNQGLKEVLDYQTRGKRVVMILLDVGEMRPDKLKDYANKYLQLGAYKVITVKGLRRSKKKRKRGVYVEFK